MLSSLNKPWNETCAVIYATEDEFGHMLGTRFRSYGCWVVIETDGHQLLETCLSLKPARPDYIVFDMLTSNLDFRTLYNRLKRTPETAHAHIIVFTTKGKAEEFTLVNSPDTVFLTPFDIEDLDADVHRNRTLL